MTAGHCGAPANPKYKPELERSYHAPLPQDDTLQHEAPPLGEEVGPHHDTDTHQKAAPDSEKV
jgi:hypothetical protein